MVQRVKLLQNDHEKHFWNPGLFQVSMFFVFFCNYSALLEKNTWQHLLPKILLFLMKLLIALKWFRMINSLRLYKMEVKFEYSELRKEKKYLTTFTNNDQKYFCI